MFGAQSLRREQLSATAWTTGLLLLSAALSGTAHAQTPAPSAVIAPAPLHFAIASGSLSSALTEFGEVTGLQILYPATLARGVTTSGVQGTYQADQALNVLLAKTGLAYRFTNSRTVTLVKLPSSADDTTMTLPPIQVNGLSSQGSIYPTDPYANMVNPPTTVGSKTPIPQRDIPQTVSVITQKQIQQQNMQTLNDAMRSTPGVSVLQSDSERTSYYSRGFPIDTWLIDGVPTNQNLAAIAPDLSMYDRVEVLDGPDGLNNGFGSPGGSINLVRKRAPSVFTASGVLSGGTYADLNGEADIGGPLDKEGKVRALVVASGQTQDLQQDTTWRHDQSIYGTLEADITPTTTVRIGGSYNRVDQKAMWDGEPVYSNGEIVPLSRSTYIGAPWTHNAYDVTTAFADVTQKLGGDWNAKLSFNYLEDQLHVLNGNVWDTVDPVTNDTTFNAEKDYQDDQQKSIDLFASGPVSLLGHKHYLTFGASYEHENLSQDNYYCSDDNLFCEYTGNLYTTGFPEPAFDGPAYRRTTITNQFGLYGNARIRLADPLTLILGARVTWWNTSFNVDPNSNPFEFTNSSDHTNGKVTPYGALVYDINKTYSAYVSYTTIYVPQSAVTESGSLLPPLEGRQYEVGVKGSYFGGRLNTSGALFQLTEKNRAIDDPNDPGEGFSVPTGKARSRGVELTATGNLTRDWSLFAGYTYTDAEYLDSSTNADGIGFDTIAPRDLFKLWINYRLPGRWHKFTVGGGLYVTSETSATSNDVTVKQGAYATVDARVGYDINDHLSASMNVTNLFNQKYYDVTTVGSAFYGEPASVIFTLRAHL